MPQYKINIPLEGIEIYFEERPDERVLQSLRDGKWRWHRGKRCWYNKVSGETLGLADELCGSAGKPPITPPPKTDLQENRNASASEHITYQMMLNGEILARVTITKNGTQYMVNSTNNQLICADCRRIFSIHASSCPFCGSPIAHTLQTDFEILMQNQRAEQQRAEEKRRSEAEERAREARLARQREKEERQKREIEERRQIEKANHERKAAIERICANYAIERGIVEQIYRSGISPDKLRDRISRILYYKKEYPYLEISLESFITSDSIDDYISEEKRGSHIKVICTGVCSNCTRETCPMDYDE